MKSENFKTWRNVFTSYVDPMKKIREFFAKVITYVSYKPTLVFVEFAIKGTQQRTIYR